MSNFSFNSMMPITPVTTYLPAAIIGLVFSIIIARSADKRGYYAFHGLIGVFWSLAGFLALELMKDDAGRWNFYGAALFVASSPVWHGMHIAWMSTNLAPLGKRTLALGAVIGAANICGVPGSQIYRKYIIILLVLFK